MEALFQFTARRSEGGSAESAPSEQRNAALCFNGSSRSPIPPPMARRASDCSGYFHSNMHHADPHIIALPGAWAMGDGLLVETHLPPVPVGRRRRAASVASYSPGSGSISESLYRIAGSVTASMSGYIQDLANWAAEHPDEDHEGEITVSGGSFFDGGQLLFPRSNSCPKAEVGLPAVPSKKHE